MAPLPLLPAAAVIFTHTLASLPLPPSFLSVSVSVSLFLDSISYLFLDFCSIWHERVRFIGRLRVVCLTQGRKRGGRETEGGGEGE